MSIPAEEKQTFLFMLIIRREVHKYEKMHSFTYCLLWKLKPFFLRTKKPHMFSVGLKAYGQHHVAMEPEQSLLCILLACRKFGKFKSD